MVARPFASTGSPPRIGDVHVDTIQTITRRRGFRRTTNTLESGVPLTIHRKRKAEGLTIAIVASDKEPIVGISLTPLWEFRHAKKVEERLQAAMAGAEEITIWTGTEFLRTPEGKSVWVIDDIDDTLTAPETGVYRATLTIGEARRSATAFTSALPDVDESLTDVTGEPADRGRQSTSALTSEQIASLFAGSWPS